jgi:hypothetical protein
LLKLLSPRHPGCAPLKPKPGQNALARSKRRAE